MPPSRALTDSALPQGLMHAEERHGFEGDGFMYMRSPLWWMGTVTSETSSSINRSQQADIKGNSGAGRDLQFRGIRICSGNPRHASRRIIGVDRSSSGFILSRRKTWDLGKAWVRDLPLGRPHNRPSCATRRGNRDDRADYGTCNPARSA
jgi:hypothetical protein